MDDNKIRIKINLNGEDFMMTIDRQTEENVRAAAKRVNMTLDQARKMFGTEKITENRLLTLVSYQLALSSIRAEKEGNSKQFSSKIEEWDNLLEEKILSDYTDNIAFVGKKTPSNQG